MHATLRPYLPVRVNLGAQVLHRCIWAIQFVPGVLGTGGRERPMPSMFKEAQMTGDTLLRRLETEEEQVRARLELLRGEAAQLEEQLAHLAITQRTVTKLLADVKSTPEAPSHNAEGARSDEQFAPGARDANGSRPPSGEAQPRATSMPNQRAATGPGREQTLGPVSAKIRLLVCSADRPLTPKDVTQALGRDVTKRTSIESVRAALEKLASHGHLVKVGRGLFSAPREGGEGAA